MRIVQSERYKKLIEKKVSKENEKEEISNVVYMITDYILFNYFKKYEKEAWERFLEWVREDVDRNSELLDEKLSAGSGKGDIKAE